MRFVMNVVNWMKYDVFSLSFPAFHWTIRRIMRMIVGMEIMFNKKILVYTFLHHDGD